ncbi:MAG: TRAP transporter small permease [Pseudomonadota bacterium]
MSRTIARVEQIARLAVAVAFLMLAAAVLLQVIARTFLPWSPVWTEELARFSLLYLVACGAGLSLRTGDLVNVDLAIHLLPPTWRRITDTLTALAVAVFALCLIPPSLKFMAIGSFQTSPALAWRMDWVFATMPLVMAMLALFGFVRAVDAWRGDAPSVLDGAADG